MSFWNDVGTLLTTIENPGQGATELAQQNSGAIGAVGGLFAVFGEFFSDLTDAALWRSLAWLGVGVAMVVFGLALLLRRPIEDALGTAAKAVAL
jgi:hypothetical protein